MRFPKFALFALIALLVTAGPALAGNVGPLQAVNNLGDVASKASSRSNLTVSAYVATRSAMAALSGTTDPVVWLQEAGRQGEFQFSSANLSTQVAADTLQGIYVAPSSDATGASGAWVRYVTASAISEWWGAVGNGTADDVLPLNAFITYLKGNPGVTGYLLRKVYAIYSPLTQIDQSGVRIMGAGTGTINVLASPPLGTVIWARGNAMVGQTVLTIGPQESSGAKGLTGITLWGVGFFNYDPSVSGNNTAATDIVLKSVRQSFFDIDVQDPGTVGMIITTNTTLGEYTDTQYNTINYSCSAVQGTRAPSAICLQLTGVVGDASLNTFPNVDITTVNNLGIQEIFADTNKWGNVRISILGTSTYSWEMQGQTAGVGGVGQEVIEMLTTNKPVVARGTSSGYTIGTNGDVLQWNNKGTGAADPVVETGATFWWQNNNTPIWSGASTSWTPTVTTQTGTITTLGTVTASYIRVGFLVFYRVVIPITTNGTGAVSLEFTAPPGTGNPVGVSPPIDCRTDQAKACSGAWSGGTAFLNLYDGSYPGGDGRTITAGGWFMSAGNPG